MTKTLIIYALTFEYSYPNNNDGAEGSPDEAGGILGLYEDKDDAQAALKQTQESGDWGDFTDADANSGWSSGGYILTVQDQEVIPSSKRK